VAGSVDQKVNHKAGTQRRMSLCPAQWMLEPRPSSRFRPVNECFLFSPTVNASRFAQTARPMSERFCFLLIWAGENCEGEWEKSKKVAAGRYRTDVLAAWALEDSNSDQLMLLWSRSNHSQLQLGLHSTS
jgi:hypothetical protein